MAHINNVENLHIAVRRGNYSRVERLLNAGVDPDAKHCGLTALHKAVIAPQWRILRKLLEFSKDATSIMTEQIKSQSIKLFHYRTNAKVTLFRLVCSAGQVDIVETLLKMGVDPDVKHSRSTALHVAVQGKQWETLRKLLEFSRDAVSIMTEQLTVSKFLHYVFKDPETLFQLLCFSGPLDIVETLLKMGVDPDVKHRGFTGLRAAFQGKQWNTLTKLLEFSRAAVTIVNEPLFDDKTLFQSLCLIGEMDIVETLLLKGVDPDVRHFGSTALHAAARGGQWDILRKLLEFSKAAASIVTEQTYSGETLLHVLCDRGPVDIVRTLMLKGADPLVKNNRGQTLMACSAMNQVNVREDLIREIIQSGASTHEANMSAVQQYFLNRSAMLSALDCGSFKIAKMLHASGACSQREIHELSSSSRIRERLESTKNWDLLNFLDHISSYPRTLTDLCALRVSHLIGCGPARRGKVKQTGLPPHLCLLVTLDHVTDPDFLKNCPP